MSSHEYMKVRKGANYKQVPGWKEYCSVSHSDGRESFLHWAANKKPRHGPLFEQMKRTRSYFKFTLRQCRANQDIRFSLTILPRNRSLKTPKNFWQEINKLKGGASDPLVIHYR